MTIRRSQGKARPELPRSRELKAVPAVRLRSDSRDGHGRFAKGNAGGKGRGWKHAIAKMLGRDVGDLADVATSVAEDAWRLFSVSIREMPSDGANVRALVARKARHEALEGYWTAQALAKLGTPEGDAAEAKATLHGQRAERLTVTALDVATRLAQARPAAQRGDLWQALGIEPLPEQRDAKPANVEQPTLDEDDDEPNAATDSSSDEREEDGPTVEATRPRARPAPSSGQSEQETRVSCSPTSAERSPITVAPPTSTGRPAPQPPIPIGPLCVHGAAARVCVYCWRANLDAQPHAAPWRSLQPGGRK